MAIDYENYYSSYDEWPAASASSGAPASPIAPQSFQTLAAASTPTWSTSQTFEQALPGLQAAGHENIMNALAAYNAAQQKDYFFTPATGAGIAALSPTTANDLMIRSMTTGVPTQEFNKYGGYDVVKNLYDKAGGSYSLESISPQKITDLAKTIAGQGFGNYAALIEAGIPDLRVNWTPQQLSFGQQFYENQPTGKDLFNVSSKLGFSPDQMANLLYQSSGADFKNTLEKIEDYLIRERKSLPGGYRYDLSQFPKTGIESLLKDSGQKFETYAGLEPGQAGIDKLIGYDPTKITNLPSLYQAVLGRAPDTGGLEFYKAIAEGGISPEEYREFLKAAQPELQVQKAYYDVLGRKYDPTGLSYYTELVKSGQLPLTDLAKTLASGATGVDIVPAQAYEILGSPGYLGRFEKAQAGIEKEFGLPAGSLATGITQKDLATKSAEEIQNILHTSGANRYQEASRTAATLKNLYDLTEDQAKQIGSGLLKGQTDNKLAKEYYNALVQGKPTKDIEDRLIEDAAKKNPNSAFFKNNPDLLAVNQPVGEIKAGDKSSGQYGRLSSGLPILNKKVADEDVLGDEVIRGLNKEFREDFAGVEKLGADIESDYRGRFARGIGALGVTANKNDVSDFSKIEKELEKLGGIKREADGTDYVDIPTADGVQRVRAQDFFDTGGEFAYNGAERYKLYNETKDRLNDIAVNNKVDPAAFKDVKDMYDTFNDKYKDEYVWQGRTQSLQLSPEQAKALGIEGDPNDSKTHAAIRYRAEGDKLVPVKVVDSFQFQDPKADTIGREITREILMNPVLQAAAMGAFMSTGAGAGLAKSIGESVYSGMGLQNLGISALTPEVVGKAILSGGVSGITSGLAGGAEKFLPGFLSGTTGGLLSGVTADSLGPVASRMLGSTVARGLMGQDVEDYLTKQLATEGLSSLLGMADPGVGQAARIFSAFSGPLSKGQLSPSDIVALSRAIGRG